MDKTALVSFQPFVAIWAGSKQSGAVWSGFLRRWYKSGLHALRRSTMGPRLIQHCGALALFTLLLQLPSAFAQSLSIEGTYRLVSRTLKDGTVLKPPEAIGLQTYTKEHRQFNIIGKDPEGKIIS